MAALALSRGKGRTEAVIRVEAKPEPPDFDRKVGRPGKRFLAKRAQGQPLRPYWRECLDQLCESYGRVCAYLALYIPGGVGQPTVDHFHPSSRSRYRSLAYEWLNYRLACSLMNARKRDFEDVVDPFKIQNSWFALEFSSLAVMPGPGLRKNVRQRVNATIERLKLNDKECTDSREAYFSEYRRVRQIDPEAFDILRRRAPFIASELERQGLV